MNNNIRFDLSDYLIHFFRDIDLSSSNGIVFPEHMGWQNLYEDVSFPAIFMLRAALRNGRLWATWSIRGDKRTIYGYDPAICFTEMPIAAFLEAGHKRWSSGQAMSPYALIFPRKELFNLGARPVISGLSTDRNIYSHQDEKGNRFLPEDSLPFNEQYRYITFDIRNSRNIDWTHEREWRWPYRGGISKLTSGIEEWGYVSNWYDIPGMDFYKNGLTALGVIVKTTEQANLVVSDILTLVDGGQVSFDTFGFILASDLLPTTDKLINPNCITSAIGSAMIDLSPYFLLSVEKCSEYDCLFTELVKKVSSDVDMDIYNGEMGGCWLWLHDNTSELTRALLNTERVFVSTDGRYLANLPEFSSLIDLRKREGMVSTLSELVNNKFGTSSCFFSVLNSNNPSDVPFYIDNKIDDNIPFFNCSWNY